MFVFKIIIRNKRRIVMKKLKNLIGYSGLKLCAMCAFGAAVLSANTLCWTFMYQDKMPDSVKRLKMSK